MFRPAPLFALLALVAGCTPVCPSPQALSLADGGVARCVLAVDCERPQDTPFCGSTQDRLKGCVACEDSVCTRFVPGACP